MIAPERMCDDGKADFSSLNFTSLFWDMRQRRIQGIET